jgi:hypothetical protein
MGQDPARVPCKGIARGGHFGKGFHPYHRNKITVGNVCNTLRYSVFVSSSLNLQQLVESIMCFYL